MSNLYNISSNEYYSADELIKAYPAAFIGAKSTRKYIDKHGLSPDHYIFARQDKQGNWRESDGKSTRVDKVFLSRDYVETNIINTPAQDMNSEKSGRNDRDNKEDNILSSEEHINLINMAKEEKFRDNDGNIHDIEIRGQRHYKKCYFRLTDISRLFKMPNLKNVVLNKDNNYQRGIDYVVLLVSRQCNITVSRAKVARPRKSLFLTYKGLMRTIFASKSGVAHKFIDWASEIIYTAHMGTKPQRQKVAAKMIGTSARNVKAVFDKSLTGLAFLYLLRLGPVILFRDKLNIGPEYSDDDIVYKYGRTDDLARRMKEHNKTYNTETNVEYYINIDPKYTAEAESSFATFIKGMRLYHSHKKYNELCIIPADEYKSMLSSIKNNMSQLSDVYMGSLASIKSEKDKLIIEYEKTINERLAAKDDQTHQERAELMNMLEKERAINHELMRKMMTIGIASPQEA